MNDFQSGKDNLVNEVQDASIIIQKNLRGYITRKKVSKVQDQEVEYERAKLADLLNDMSCIVKDFASKKKDTDLDSPTFVPLYNPSGKRTPVRESPIG